MTPLSRPRRRRAAVARALITSAAIASCGTGQSRTGALVPGQRAAMGAIGYSPIGTPFERAIERGQIQSHEIEFAPGRCYQILALGGGGSLDLETALYAPSGALLRQTLASGNASSVSYCPSERGRFRFVVSARSGVGSYLTAVWERDQERSGDTTRQGTCRAPTRIALGERINGSLAEAIDNASAACAAGRNPDVVHLLEVERRQTVTLSARGTRPVALYLRRDCRGGGAGRAPSEDAGRGSRPTSDDEFAGTTIACSVPREGHETHLTLSLDPGRYFVFVEAVGDEQRGEFTLSSSEGESAAASDVCGRAAALPLPAIARAGASGVPATISRGSTSRAADVLHGSCASSRFPGPDVTYAMEVPETLRVRVSVEADGRWDTGVYIRRDCVAPETEVACNDDADDRFHAEVARTLERGRYTVTVDGYSVDDRGPFSLAVQTSPSAGSGVPGDACADAIPLPLGGTADGDTFAARDDLAVRCGGVGPDQLFRFTLPQRALVRASLTERGGGSTGGFALAFVRGCAPNGGVVGETACSRDGAIDAILPAGVHHLVVDGEGRNDFGRFAVALSAESAEPVEAACRARGPLPLGAHITGTTSGQPDRLHASCGRGARSGDATHALFIPRSGRLSLRLRAQGFDGVLSLRRACERATTELGCSAEAEQGVISLSRDVVAGEYTVVVDGFDRDQTGAYDLEARLE
jgi:hypothetical protein